MGIPSWEWYGNGNKSQNWEWEGMGMDCMGMGGSGNMKSHSRSSLVPTHNASTHFTDNRVCIHLLNTYFMAELFTYEVLLFYRSNLTNRMQNFQVGLQRVRS